MRCPVCQKKRALSKFALRPAYAEGRDRCCIECRKADYQRDLAERVAVAEGKRQKRLRRAVVAEGFRLRQHLEVTRYPCRVLMKDGVWLV